MAGLFEKHDRNRFETYAFSFGPVKKDAMRARAEAAFDHFVEASELSDKAIALLARHFEIDIAIDLKGFTTHSRAGIFSYRAAPIQINYLGYPGTMGANFIDYIIADETVIPQDYEKFYTEKVIHTACCYQVNDSKRLIPEFIFSRTQLGLPENAFVFSSFNNNFKITPNVFDVWCRLLKNVNDSVLWLLADNPVATNNLRREALSRDIDPDRLVFAPRVRPEQHLARHAAADLFLDCFPCSAHTTASDALLAGLPIVTLRGETFASRVASSLLKSVGLTDLICDTIEEYQNIAENLAKAPSILNEIKNNLKTQEARKILYNTNNFTQEFEEILTNIYNQDNKIII
jgi:predicted O-linked N-acetylglucosamine transferase (SPINDLY family)